jgi:hypothetical protein
VPTSPWTTARALLFSNTRRLRASSNAPASQESTPAASTTEPKAELTVYSGEPGYAVAVTGRCLIHVNQERMTSTTVSLIRRALADLADQYDTFGYLSVLESGGSLTMAPDLRESVDAYVRRYSTRFTGAAIVFEAAGFQATVVRSVVTAVNLASRASHPTKVFDDLRTGCSWLGRLTPGEPTASRLYELTTQLRKTK